MRRPRRAIAQASHFGTQVAAEPVMDNKISSVAARALAVSSQARVSSSRPPQLGRRETLLGMASAGFLGACSGTDFGADGLLPTQPGSGSRPSPSGPVDWATGGTAAIAEHYPDPFAASLGVACTLPCRTTLGPCYAATIERKDISEGRAGLPVRLSFLVVDDNCAPMPGISVDIWHASRAGLYSGDDTGRTLDGGQLGRGFPCTGGDADAETSRFFRGVQTTDARGRVDFDTCYPGWYPGRAVHIHFILRRGGVEYVTSQLYYPEELTTELLLSHPEYSEFGTPDTLNSTDRIFAGAPEVLEAQRQPDGVLLASKVLVMRSSLDDALCGTSRGGPPPPAAG